MTQANYPLISRFIGFSLFGVIIFFVPLPIAGRTTILLDHCVIFLTDTIPIIGQICVYMLIISGGLQPFMNRSWRSNSFETILAILKFCAIPISLAHLIGIGPDILMADDMTPFLLEKLVTPVGLIIPIGAIFLSFLVGYGLLEFIGVLMEPIMRPLWRIPGRSAIDAIASFAGSYSIGLLITNKVYRDGGYSLREAAVIATGFSTVSASFMVIVARTLDFIDQWTFFFWSTLGITFLVTALSVRIWPLCVLDNKHKRNTYNIDKNLIRRFKYALDVGLQNDTKSTHNSK